jgi:hypothetical protein
LTKILIKNVIWQGCFFEYFKQPLTRRLTMGRRKVRSLFEQACDAVRAYKDRKIALSALLDDDVIHLTPIDQGIAGQLDAVRAVVHRVEFAAFNYCGTDNSLVVEAVATARLLIPTIAALLELLGRLKPESELELVGHAAAVEQCLSARETLDDGLSRWGY